MLYRQITIFSDLDHFFRGKEFPTEAAIKTALEEYFTSKSPSFYKKGIESLSERWAKNVNNDGDYVID